MEEPEERLRAVNPVTLDISTIIIMVVNIVFVVGAFYAIKISIAEIKKDMEHIRSDLREIKKKADERGTRLESVEREVAVLSSHAGR